MSNMIVFLYIFITDYLKVPTYILCQQHKTSFGQSPIRVFVEPSKKKFSIESYIRQQGNLIAFIDVYVYIAQPHKFIVSHKRKQQKNGKNLPFFL